MLNTAVGSLCEVFSTVFMYNTLLVCGGFRHLVKYSLRSFSPCSSLYFIKVNIPLLVTVLVFYPQNLIYR